jgi:hypothetical protein
LKESGSEFIVLDVTWGIGPWLCPAGTHAYAVAVFTALCGTTGAACFFYIFDSFDQNSHHGLSFDQISLANTAIRKYCDI